MYDPTIGQFIDDDPIGFEDGDTNPHEYAGNSPTNSGSLFQPTYQVPYDLAVGVLGSGGSGSGGGTPVYGGGNAFAGGFGAGVVLCAQPAPPAENAPASSTADLPPDPTRNSVVSDGNGNLVVQFGTENAPNAPKIIMDAVKLHEERHIKDLQKLDPNAAKGVAKGRIVTFADKHDLWQSEINASQDEIDYLTKHRDDKGISDAEKKQIDAMIKKMETYRDSFKQLFSDEEMLKKIRDKQNHK